MDPDLQVVGLNVTGVGVAACPGEDLGRKHVGVGGSAWAGTWRRGPAERLRRERLIHMAETQGPGGDDAEQA